MTFRLRTMFAVAAIIAGMIVFLPPAIDWWENPPSVPLSTVVATFNDFEEQRFRPHNLTEDEVVASIESQLPGLVAAERVKQVLRRITKNQRVPPSTKIIYQPIPIDTPPDQVNESVWLLFERGANEFHTYSIKIR